MKTLLRAWQIATLYIGTIVGAGFASGQEIELFFSRRGAVAWVGILFTAIGFYGLATWIVQKSQRHKAQSLQQLLTRRFGEKTSHMVSLLLIMLLFGVSSAMIAGGAQLLHDLFHVPLPIASGLIALWTFFFLYRGLYGLYLINQLVVPLMLSIIVWLFVLQKKPSLFMILSVNPNQMFQSFGHALPYLGFNLGLSLGILVAIGSTQPSRRALHLGLLFGAAGLLVAMGIIHSLLIANPTGINHQALPIYRIATTISQPIAILFAISMIGEILTTLIANIYSMAIELHHRLTSSYLKNVGILLVLAYLCSQLGFEQIVTQGYPLLGLMGLFLLVITLIS